MPTSTLPSDKRSASPRRSRPKTHDQPWPIGAYFHTWKVNDDGTREINYQGRVLAFDGTTLWGELYSWLDGGANGIKALPFVADAFSFYLSDREMRQREFEANRYRLHYVGTWEENDWYGERGEHTWKAPLPTGFESLP